MALFQLIGMLVIFNVLLIGIYLAVRIYLRKYGSKIRKMLLLYITFILLAGVFLLPFFLLIETEPMIAGVFRLMGMISATESLYFLNAFSRVVARYKKNTKHQIKVKLVFVMLPIMILLPWNHWNILYIYDIDGWSLQPITIFAIFMTAVYVFATTIIRSKHAVNRIKDPALKETYKWIHRSCIAICFSLPALLSNLIFHIAPPSEYLFYFSMFAFAIGSVGVITSIVGIYIGLKFPKTLLRRVYEQYEPMWNKYDAERRLTDIKLKKLEELFFD